MDGGEIAGIAIGAVAAVGLTGAVGAFFFYHQKKEKKKEKEEEKRDSIDEYYEMRRSGAMTHVELVEKLGGGHFGEV